MPLYDYSCTDCGPFRGWKAMRDSMDTIECPVCERLSGRMITAPFIADMPNNNRIAHQRNEKSADQPKVMNKSELGQAGQPRKHHHTHGGNHSHCGGHHNHHTGRPWMIGH